MRSFTRQLTNLSARQEAIREKSFHPQEHLKGFPKEEIEQSIPARFGKIVAPYESK